MSECHRVDRLLAVEDSYASSLLHVRRVGRSVLWCGDYPDFNGAGQEALGLHYHTARHGSRASTAHAFLVPVCGCEHLR